MKSLYKRKILLILLFILIVYRSVNLPYTFSSSYISDEKVPITKFIKHADNAHMFILLQKIQVDEGIHSNINSILIILVPWNFVLSSLFLLKFLIIDKRKRILLLVAKYFDGGKYNITFSFSQ